MYRLLLSAVAFLLMSTVLPCLAQDTGANMLDGLGKQLGKAGIYRVERDGNLLRLLDRKTGSEIATVRELDRHFMMISGVIAHSAKVPAPAPLRMPLAAQIDMFNISSPVGTLTYDEATGTSTMTHAVDARRVSLTALADVATRCCNAVVNERMRLLQ